MQIDAPDIDTNPNRRFNALSLYCVLFTVHVVRVLWTLLFFILRKRSQTIKKIIVKSTKDTQYTKKRMVSTDTERINLSLKMKLFLERLLCK